MSHRSNVGQNFGSGGGRQQTSLTGAARPRRGPTSTRVAAAPATCLRYVGSLVSANGDVVSFIESNKFIMI